VVMFSGGWDARPGGDSADWYGRASVTPLQRWRGTLDAGQPE
jgi:hypothetical protein